MLCIVPNFSDLQGVLMLWGNSQIQFTVIFLDQEIVVCVTDFYIDKNDFAVIGDVLLTGFVDQFQAEHNWEFRNI